MVTRKVRQSGLNQNKSDEVVAAVAGAGCLGLIGFLILIKLAFLALIGWGIFELVSWVITK